MGRKKSATVIIALILALGFASVGGALLMNHNASSGDCLLAANQNFDCGRSLMASSTSHLKMFDSLTQAILASSLSHALLVIFLILSLVLLFLTLFNLMLARPLGFVYSKNFDRPRGPSLLHWLALFEHSPSSS